MNTRGTAGYFKIQHGILVTRETVLKWFQKGYIKAEQMDNGRWWATEEAVDTAVQEHSVPPKVGRKRKFSREDRLKMVKMCEKHTLKEVAKHFQCDISYVSLVRRGKR